MDNQAIPGERASVWSNMLRPSSDLPKVDKPDMAATLGLSHLAFLKLDFFPTLYSPFLPSHAQVKCHQLQIAIDKLSLWNQRPMWATTGRSCIKGLFEKITCWGLSFYYSFFEKRKFTRCKGLTQYIIIGDNSHYTLTQALAWPVSGRTWHHECIWDPSWTSRKEPQCERRVQWQMMVSQLVPKVS